MKKKLPVLLMLTCLLGACSLDINIGSSSSSDHSVTTSGGNGESSSTITPTTSGGSGTSNTTNTPNTSTSSNTVSDTDGAKKLLDAGYTNTLRDTNSQIGWNTLNSTGNQKVLVVPVHFKNATTWSTSMLSDLDILFFGDASYTAWESVSSYFEKSSYGNLHLSGEVYDTVLEVPLTAASYNSKYNSDQTGSYDPGTYIGNLFYDSLDASGMKKMKEYDQDNDGYIDAVIFCYSNAFSSTASGAYWAWCSYTDNDPNMQGPTVNNYMWVSYEFIHEGYGTKKIDGHTFIHEMGHIIGLDDYYCYDDASYDGYYPWNSAGELDMQSYNVGDHNIYSKFASGWVNPLHVTETQEVTLRSSALYGDAVLIKDNWNGTIFDEYLMVEYYTPEGMNQKDSETRYSSRDYMYQDSGLRIYHVDARMAKLNARATSTGYANTAKDIVNTFNSTSSFGYVAASNSVSYSYVTDSTLKEKGRLLHLIDQGGNNTIANGISGKDSYGTYVDPDSTLWQAGDVFTATKSYFYKGDNTFNDGTKVGYSITVKSMNETSITLQINKL